MPQHFFCALALTVTLTTNLTPMTRDNDHRDGSKLTLPRFDPKDPTFFDDLQAYAQDRGLGWLLHADGDQQFSKSLSGRAKMKRGGRGLDGLSNVEEDLLIGHQIFNKTTSMM